MSLHVLFWNACGLANPQKQQKIFQQMKNYEKMQFDSTVVFCLQEMHTQKGQEQKLLLQLDPGYSGIWSSKSSN